MHYALRLFVFRAPTTIKFAMYPRKLYVETTTRCNMNCAMCVKHVPGSTISNKHLEFRLYRKLTPLFPYLEALVLNGIGEPLLHPDLIPMVRMAREAMPESSWIGFQSNGQLLAEGNVRELIHAGLNRICISVDDSGDGCCTALGHTKASDSSPIELVNSVRREVENNLRLGAEIVLFKESIPKLPELVRKLAGEGVDFILGSHLLAYHQDAEDASLFNSCTTESWELFRKWKEQAVAEGIDIAPLTARSRIAPRLKMEQKMQALYREMLDEARASNIWMHVTKLDQWDEQQYSEAERYVQEAIAIAESYNIEISLPPLAAATERSCSFIENGSTFVDVDGSVMPCHPLWHDQTLHMDGDPKQVTKTVFGTVKEQDIVSIYQSPEYTEFRNAVLKYDYPYCHSCMLSPCPDITGEQGPFENDCFGIAVPCGHCLWCYDAIRCM